MDSGGTPVGDGSADSASDPPASGPVGSDPVGSDTVVLRLPCDGAHVRLVRRLATTLGARLDLTVDELDDLRTAVHEAAVLLSGAAAPDSVLTVTFTTVTAVPDAVLSVVLQAPVQGRVPLPRSGIAWLLLSQLADDLTSSVAVDGTATVSLRVRPSPPVLAGRGSGIPAPRQPSGAQ